MTFEQHCGNIELIGRTECDAAPATVAPESHPRQAGSPGGDPDVDRLDCGGDSAVKMTGATASEGRQKGGNDRQPAKLGRSAQAVARRNNNKKAARRAKQLDRHAPP